MTDQETIPSRTLNEWHDYIVSQKHRAQWNDASWWTKQWWFRQWVNRTLRGQSARSVIDDWTGHIDSYGAPVEAITGKSVGRQFLEMAYLFMTCGVNAHAYYTYKLYRRPRFRKARRFIYHHPKIKLNEAIKKFTEEHASFNTRDKRSWFRWASAHDVPSARQLATFEDGEVELFEWGGRAAALPRKDLFSIATNVWRGHGAVAWKWKDGRYTDVQQPKLRLDAEELIAFLKRKSTEFPISLQVRMRNHLVMQDFTNGALATFRLVTGRHPDSSPQPIIAVLKMPTADDVVDNGNNHVASAVHLTSGRLGPAWYKYPGSNGDHVTHHPDTKKRIRGRVLDFFPDICKVAVTTHRKMPWIPFVGWDITYTTDGVRIVEPNEGWGAEGTEIPLGRPLSNTLYEPMYDAWMQHFLS